MKRKSSSERAAANDWIQLVPSRAHYSWTYISPVPLAPTILFPYVARSSAPLQIPESRYQHLTTPNGAVLWLLVLLGINKNLALPPLLGASL